jgi:hypothetical protein
MACPGVTISLLPVLLGIGTVGAAMSVSLLGLYNSKLEADHQLDKRRAVALRAAGKAAARKVAPAAVRPVVTRMKDFARLEAALAGPGRRVAHADNMLVLMTREAALTFRHGADSLIVAELARGDAETAKALLHETQARYLAAVREDTAAQLQARAPAAGWTVEKRETARDGSIEVTLHKASPRAKKAVAIG